MKSIKINKENTFYSTKTKKYCSFYYMNSHFILPIAWENSHFASKNDINIPRIVLASMRDTDGYNNKKS